MKLPKTAISLTSKN